MIGLGTWTCKIDTMIFKGDVTLTISDNGGDYDFELILPGADAPDFSVKNIVEDGNTLSGIINIDLLKGKDIPISLTFDGDTLSGGLTNVPFIKKINFKDGRRVK
ncbi:MAG: hypothetical protein IJM97_07355 [Clostridia bacterium]|nr:hypothetical protein [Clostridia bacterium]